MKRAPRSRQRHDLYAKYHDYDSEISDLLGECGSTNVLHRPVRRDQSDITASPNVYHLPNLKNADLSFAGRQGDQHEIHDAVRHCRVGDSLTLELRDANWILIDQRGRVIGRMSRTWKHPPGHTFLEGRVGAVIRWRKSDGEERYAGYCRRDTWETVLPEIVFAPRGYVTRNAQR